MDGNGYEHREGQSMSATTWRRSSCRCAGCWRAEARQRYRELAQATKPVQVHGRRYTTRERLAIGTALGVPGGLATQSEIARWLAIRAEDAITQATWDLYETMAARVAELEESGPCTMC